MSSNNPQVTVEIHADTSPLKNELGNIANTPPTTTPTNTPTPTPTPTTSMPTENSGGTIPTTLSERMVQDIRREMMSRGVMMVPGSSNFNQMMNTILTQKRKEIDAGITSKYESKWETLESEKETESREFMANLVSKYNERLAQGPDDPLYRLAVARDYKDMENRGMDKILEKYGKQGDRLIEEEATERAQAEKELTKAVEALTEEMQRDDNSNSYMGRLREKYRDAINRRDNAETEEEANKAATEAAEIQQRMNKAVTPIDRYAQLMSIIGGANQVVGITERGIDAWRQNYLMKIGEISAVANGDIFSAMQQDLERRRLSASTWGAGIGTLLGGIIGGIFAGSSSLGVGTAAGIGGGAMVGGAFGGGLTTAVFNWINSTEEREIRLGQLWQQQEQRIRQYNDVALAYRRDQDLSYRRFSWMYELNPDVVKRKSGDNINYYDLGYTGSQFSSIISQRIKQRGYISETEKEADWELENYIAKQVALERAYNMSEGSISQYSMYDRYGNNANQDIANLIASLKNRKVLGMSGGQTLRANEFLGYQTQLMEMQKGWMDAPNANYATRLLLAGQAAFGNNLDARAISEIGQIENTVTHPKEDYSKALLYDVIQEVIPGTKGNLLAIRQAQYSNNPEVRMKIQRAMAKKIQQVYGGLNTTSGYLAASHYYGIEDPDRLRAIIGQYEKGLPVVNEGNVQSDANILKGYTPNVSKSMLEYQDNTVLEISNQLGRLEDIGNKLLLSFNTMLRELINEFK